MDLAKYKNIFAQESRKYLEDLEPLLISVEKELSNRELWEQIHGKIHSIKGMARALSMETISSLCHLMEEWCKQFQQGFCKAAKSNVQSLFEGLDVLALLVSSWGVDVSPEQKKKREDLMARFEREPFQDLPEAAMELESISVHSPKGIEHVRVEYSVIEELLGHSQEIILLDKSLPSLSEEQISSGLRNWIDHCNSMLKGLYLRLAMLRLAPVADFAKLFDKTIRDLARKHGKEAKMEILGGEILVDIALMNRLKEPFMHLMRNFIAHGIETPEERTKAGKEREGRILLEAERKNDKLLLKMEDDGMGIDQIAVKRFLKEKKSMKDGEISRLSEEELLKVIFLPGFSTAHEATTLAGRGIGMDVVIRAIETLGGSIEVFSAPFKYTRFVMQFPLFLSVFDAFIFTVGPYRLSIPTTRIEAVESVASAAGMEKRASLVSLKEFLCIEQTADRPSHIIRLKGQNGETVSNSDSSGMRFAVDSIIGNTPLMAMPVGELLAKAKLFAGIGMMENGEISMLLDVEKLQKVLQKTHRVS